MNMLDANKRKKVLVVFGTRPEAVKLCPLVRELQKRPQLETVVCVTGQHREMLDQILQHFCIVPEYDLALMKERQMLFDITANVLLGIQPVLVAERPDVVLVQGDTLTTFAAALAAYYMRIPVGHVEAGLRTNNIYSPFPEEFNRTGVGIIAAYHFAPTDYTRDNLLREGKPEENVFVTGNTVIDALKTTIREDFMDENLKWASGSRLVLLTAHRRENLGKHHESMFRAIRRVVEEIPDIKVIFPIHLNPAVRDSAALLQDCPRIRMVEPLNMMEFHNYIARAYVILTDSGGIQEEASGLHKPTLVLRGDTERSEGIEAGTLRLVGTDEQAVYESFKRLMTDEEMYGKMSDAAINPYGDGHACERIADILIERLCGV